MVWIPLILDTFVFDEARLETPEAFGDMGGTQSLSCHDFPGGVRTHKSFGYFPAEQKWRAKFHGTDASDRVEGVKRILFTGREVQLSYGARAWLGRVARFSPTARSSWLYDYELEFWPRIDISSGGPTGPEEVDLSSIIDLHILALTGLLNSGLSADFAFQAMGLVIGGPIGLLIFSVQAALAAAGGSITAIDTATQEAIFASTLAALAVTQPYTTSVYPTQSSPAAEATARIQAIQTIMSGSQPPITTLQTVNPNLVVLAAQYYSGDYSKWRLIAAANGLADPQPLGSFNLTIPQAA